MNGLENQCMFVEISSKQVGFCSGKNSGSFNNSELLLTHKILAECFSDLLKNDCRSK